MIAFVVYMRIHQHLHQFYRFAKNGFEIAKIFSYTRLHN